MTLRSFILCTSLAASALSAQEAAGPDRVLEEMESRLQEQRAAALRTRLLIAADELTKLQSQMTASGDAAAVAHVQKDLDGVQHAIKQLANIVRRQADPPAPGELKEDEQLSPTALAKWRIDRIIGQFTVARSEPRPDPGTLPANARTHVLKMDKARLRSGSGAGDVEGDYWIRQGDYALWTVPGLGPGSYDVILRCTAGPDAGGTATVKLAGENLTVKVPAGEKGGREQRLSAGTITIKDPGVDVRVECTALAEGAKHLWKLEGVLLQPAAKRP
jgi:hypothetical protein